MSEQMLNILKLALLGLIYLFLFRVLRAVVGREMAPASSRRGWGTRRPRRGGGRPPAPSATARAGARGERPVELFAARGRPTRAGRRYPLGDEITVGTSSRLPGHRR